MKKINNRIKCTHTQWACSQSVKDYLLRWWNLPTLAASIAAIINVDDLNGADSQSANAENVKKINNRVDSAQTQWSCSPSVPDYLSKEWNLPSLTAANSVISNVDDVNVKIRKLLMQEMWKKSTIALNAHILSELAPNLCKIICWEDEIFPVWWPLSLRSSTLMTWMVQIRKALMRKMWKQSTKHKLRQELEMQVNRFACC